MIGEKTVADHLLACIVYRSLRLGLFGESTTERLRSFLISCFFTPGPNDDRDCQMILAGKFLAVFLPIFAIFSVDCTIFAPNNHKISNLCRM